MSDGDLELAKLFDKAERYEDMAKHMKKYADEKETLDCNSRNLLSVAYKNVVGSRRSSWRVLASFKGKAESGSEQEKITTAFSARVVDELKDICREVLDLLEKTLIEKADDTESKVFYLKMKGDYYRYLCEVTDAEERKKGDDVREKSEGAYREAFSICKAAKISPTHPIRLGLALNFSVFCYEIKESNEEACKLAKEAFDEAISELDSVQEDSYKDSTLIMQLLRDNLTLWTSQDNPDEDGEDN